MARFGNQPTPETATGYLIRKPSEIELNLKDTYGFCYGYGGVMVSSCFLSRGFQIDGLVSEFPPAGFRIAVCWFPNRGRWFPNRGFRIGSWFPNRGFRIRCLPHYTPLGAVLVVFFWEFIANMY